MAKLNVAQTAFSAGELSPGMYGRSDLREHSEGAKTISNFIVRPQGGLTRRPGSVFAGATLADAKTRLVPFPISDHRFVIEVSESMLRVWEEIDGTLALMPNTQRYFFPSLASGVWQAATSQYWTLDMDRADFPIASGMGPYAIVSNGGSVPAALAAASPNIYLHVHTSTTGNPWASDHDDLIAPTKISFYDAHSKSVFVDNADFIVLGANPTGFVRLETQNEGFHTSIRSLGGAGEHLLDNLQYARSDDTLWILLPEVEENADPAAASYRTHAFKIRYFEKGYGDAYDTGLADLDVGQSRIEIEAIHANNEGPFHTISEVSEFASPAENLEWNEVSAQPLTVVGENFDLSQTNVGHGATSKTGLRSPTDGDNLPFGIVYGRERVGGSTDTAGVDTNWGIGETASVFSNDGQIVRPFSRSVARIDTDLYAFGPMFTATEIWRAVELFQGRLCLAGGIRPGTVSCGSLERPMMFLPANIDGETIDGDTAFQLSIQNDQDLRINTMIATRNKLFVVTRQGVHSVGPDSTGSFEVDKFNIIPVNRVPGKDVQGVSFGDFVGYVTADGRRIMIVDVNNEGIKFNTFDLTRFSDHILEAGASTLVHQRLPESLLWARLDDGTMASITLVREEGLTAAASQTIAGDTVTVEDAISMPFHDGTEVVYLSVKRDINSATKRYIERIDSIPKYSTAIEDYVLLDSAGIYDSSAVTNVPATTFDHLNGETVDVYADGVHVGTKVISGGQFTVALTTAASKIYAGFKYNSDVELFRPVESFPSFGTTEGSLKRNIAVVTQFSNTYGGQAGSSADDLQPIKYESTTPSLITDELETLIEDEHKRDATLLVRANQPYPMDITSVTRRVDFESRGGE